MLNCSPDGSWTWARDDVVLLGGGSAAAGGAPSALRREPAYNSVTSYKLYREFLISLSNLIMYSLLANFFWPREGIGCSFLGYFGCTPWPFHSCTQVFRKNIEN